jgi:hypothetical protein
MSEISLHKKFLNGLKNKYNLTHKDLIEQDYKYAGGTPDDNNPRHYNYWNKIKLQKPYLKMPDIITECVCDHKIKNNCFIINKNDDIIVLGNCCIKKFIPKSGRTCGRCGEPHKNRKFNLCNDCKIDACNNCGGEKEEHYYRCCNKCKEESESSSSEEDGDNKEEEIVCKGNGECFEQIYYNTYKKNECNFGCELEYCLECNTEHPKWYLDCRKGLCLNCYMEISEKGNKIYLDVPYNDKEEAKQYGCRWNPNKKKWFYYEKNKNKEYITNRWTSIL